VPGDLSLARLGDPASPDPDVEWTGFRVPREEMGAAALHLLAGLVSGERTPEECMLLLPCTPDRGATAGPPAPAARPSPAAGSRA
jgi:DNA-binding LacI/PurR family transcriptional regulator